MTDRRQSFALMDCTFRDGGFQTDWRFSDAMARQYFGTCLATGVDIVELGYLNLDPGATTSCTGSYKALPESLTAQQRELINPGAMKVTVMIDATGGFTGAVTFDSAGEHPRELTPPAK